MSVLDFTPTAAAPTRTSRMPFGNQTAPNGGDKPKSTVWLDVGRTINGKFVSLPLGQGIDTMYAREVRGQDPDFVKLVNAQNELLAALQKLGMKFEPGEERTLNLEVRLRRVNAQLEVNNRDNEFVIDANSLLAADPVEESLIAAG